MDMPIKDVAHSNNTAFTIVICHIIEGYFGDFFTKRGRIFFTSKTGIPGGDRSSHG